MYMVYIVCVFMGKGKSLQQYEAKFGLTTLGRGRIIKSND